MEKSQNSVNPTDFDENLKNKMMVPYAAEWTVILRDKSRGAIVLFDHRQHSLVVQRSPDFPCHVNQHRRYDVG